MTISLLTAAFEWLEWPHAIVLSVFFVCIAAVLCMFIWGLSK